MISRPLNTKRYTLAHSSAPNLFKDTQDAIRPRLAGKQDDDKHQDIAQGTLQLEDDCPNAPGFLTNIIARLPRFTRTAATHLTSFVTKVAYSLRYLGCLAALITTVFTMLLTLAEEYISPAFRAKIPKRYVHLVCFYMRFVCILQNLSPIEGAVSCKETANYQCCLWGGPPEQSVFALEVVTVEVNPVTDKAMESELLSLDEAESEESELLPSGETESELLPSDELGSEESLLFPSDKTVSPLPYNFALADRGAKVLPALTSRTEGLNRLSLSAWLLALCRGYNLSQAHINPPRVVLEAPQSAFDCWRFNGSQGHIAFSLSDTIHWTSFAIHSPDHRELTSDQLRQSPQIFSLWALVSKEEWDPVTHNLSDWEHFIVKEGLLDSSMFNASTGFLQVAQIVYIIDEDKPQHFDLWYVVRTSVVLVEIVGNWGSSSTCVHKISIHGINAVENADFY
ncbi:hypothetical protein GYMLUDRAFT_247540 [Collybiopsis luxurians FD-317 M1]|uniref:SUN domain-containing protein n=1 Tax=Collybiopsis luxurians FD-317 M1 TaxID=944289 RepID=A0A0D0B103_9AGAR|nr:hypothetical protein GYMLUDRAFT_247540 [Collybiopsis luxurians FD-317 M1]